MSVMPRTAAQKRTSLEVRVGPKADLFNDLVVIKGTSIWPWGCSAVAARGVTTALRLHLLIGR
jgi:hypothetical protein